MIKVIRQHALTHRIHSRELHIQFLFAVVQREHTLTKGISFRLVVHSILAFVEGKHALTQRTFPLNNTGRSMERLIILIGGPYPIEADGAPSRIAVRQSLICTLIQSRQISFAFVTGQSSLGLPKCTLERFLRRYLFPWWRRWRIRFILLRTLVRLLPRK